MKFTPDTEEQITEKLLLPEGDYSFEVVKAENKVSKAGNEMIKLTLRVFPNEVDATPRMIFDYLMDALKFKLLHFCSATGMTEKYANGNLQAEDCIGKSGRCHITIKEAEGKYQASNQVKDYLKKDQVSKPKDASVQPDAEDDIAF